MNAFRGLAVGIIGCGLALGCAVMPAARSIADEPEQQDASAMPTEFPRGMAREGAETIPTHPSAVYIPYNYPAFDSCPCQDDRCFSPWRYFCGGEEYRRAWTRKWWRAHFGRGSMLDEYPCRCVAPASR